MAKRSDKKPPTKKKNKSTDEAPSPEPMEFAERDALLRAFAEVFGSEGLEDGAEDDRTPLDRAQELVFMAWEEEDELKRMMMAKVALEICPDCADAYCLLAEDTSGILRYTIELFAKGVAAGERAVGPDTFRDGVGGFWSRLETRPYMRARSGLAACLWEAGRDDEAIGHAWDMLRLNPDDDQGMRHILMHWLVETHRDDEAWRLLNQYPDELSLYWECSRALLLYRKEGDSPAARTSLKRAQKLNKHAVGFLLSPMDLPEEEPESCRVGSEEEAVLYVTPALRSWYETPGAVEWLEERTA